jgi:hypothetical protein
MTLNLTETELKLTKMEYFYLYLTFPSTITLSLVDIEPHYKRPGMRGFIEINDYENYKIQKNNLEPYYAELENIKHTFYDDNVFVNEKIKYENMKKLINHIQQKKDLQPQFILYRLSNDGTWSKILI